MKATGPGACRSNRWDGGLATGPVPVEATFGNYVRLASNRQFLFLLHPPPLAADGEEKTWMMCGE